MDAASRRLPQSPRVDRRHALNALALQRVAHCGRVLFVPCDALAKVVREYHGVDDATATQQCASATVERLFGASGVVDLARSHKRYDEIYGVKDESALR